MEHKDEYEHLDNSTALVQRPDINYDNVYKIVCDDMGQKDEEKLEEAKDEEHQEEEQEEETADGGVGGDTDDVEADRISCRSSSWHLFGRIVPKNELIFLSQVFILYIVIISCIVNLSLSIGESNMRTALLSSSLGIMLPPPTLSKKKE